MHTSELKHSIALVRSEYDIMQTLLTQHLLDSTRVHNWQVIHKEDDLPEGQNIALQWDEYERLNWDDSLCGDRIVSGYVMRKGLTRKAHLAAILNTHFKKRPGCRLEGHVPISIPVEIPTNDAEFADSIEVARETVERLGGLWMLKPSRIDRGDNKYVVSSAKEMTDTLWREREMLNWVCQRYITQPVLVDVVGSLKVFVHRPSIIVNTAALPYSTDVTSLKNSQVHISNAIFARTFHRDGFVHFDGTTTKPEKDSLEKDGVDPMMEGRQAWNEGDYKFLLPDLAKRVDNRINLDVDDIFKQICDTVEDLFCTAQMDPNALLLSNKSFEIFGLDFMIEHGNVSTSLARSTNDVVDDTPKKPKKLKKPNVLLLEVNAGSDFKSMYLSEFLSTGRKNCYYKALNSLLEATLSVVVDHQDRCHLFNSECKNKPSTLLDSRNLGLFLVHNGCETLPPWMKNGGFKIISENESEHQELRGAALLKDLERRDEEKRLHRKIQKEKEEQCGKRPAGCSIAVGDTFGYWSSGELVECICLKLRNAEETSIAVEEEDAIESTSPYGTIRYTFVEDFDENDETNWDSEWTDIDSECIVTDLVTTPVGSTLS